MTVKEEVAALKKEIKQLKKQLAEQNNKWNKILAYASMVSALAAVTNLLIIGLKK